MPDSKPVEKYCDAVSRFKREYLSRMLALHGGNRTRTARALGLQRTYLLRLIRVFELGGGAGRRLRAVPDAPVQGK